MKKMLIIGLGLFFIAASASAQTGPGERIKKDRSSQGITDGRLSRPEKFELRKDEGRYKMEQRHARRDGKVSPREHRKLHGMRKHNRHERFRFKHNKAHHGRHHRS